MVIPHGHTSLDCSPAEIWKYDILFRPLIEQGLTIDVNVKVDATRLHAICQESSLASVKGTRDLHTYETSNSPHASTGDACE